MKLFTAPQMRQVDQRAMTEGRIAGSVLMHNAGMTVVSAIERMAYCDAAAPLIVLAGRGNNGGDGFVIARALAARGWAIETVAMAQPEAYVGDAALMLAALRQDGGALSFCTDEASFERWSQTAAKPGLIVDALLGTGVNSPVAGMYRCAIEWINQQPAPVVAVDIPSGVDASDGQIWGVAVQATHTVSFAGAKVGLYSFPGATCAGTVEVTDIGIPQRYLDLDTVEVGLVDAVQVADWFQDVDLQAHKGTHGHLLIAAGSVGKTGAAQLTAASGLRSGAGLVTLACPESAQAAISAQVVEVMTEGVAAENGVLALAALSALLSLQVGKRAMVVGPGLGQTDELRRLLPALVAQSQVPLVIDADGLNALQGNTACLRQASVPIVLTPHPGEMARLTGHTIAEVQQNRLASAQGFATEHQVVVVLKGARTLIACPDGSVWVNGSGNPALATAGTGDVLAGMIGAYLTQGYPAEQAAALGAYIHGACADRLATTSAARGLIASDLLPMIPQMHAAIIEGEQI